MASLLLTGLFRRRWKRAPSRRDAQRPFKRERSLARGRELRETRRVRLFGLMDYRLNAERPLQQVTELYGSRKNAEDGLRRVLQDEPSWAGALEVIELPLVECPTPSLSFN
jgi:hypothetical protein